MDMHLILGQRSCLVGTDNGSCAHGLTSMHLTNQVIGFQHPPHAIGKTKRYCHGQTFRNSYYDQGHSYHNSL